MNYFERRDRIYEVFGKDFYERFPLSSRVLNRYIRNRVHHGDRESEVICSEYQRDKGFKGLVKNILYYTASVAVLLLAKPQRDSKKVIAVSSTIFLQYRLLGEWLKHRCEVHTILTRKNVRVVLASKIKNTIKADYILYGEKLRTPLLDAIATVSEAIDDPGKTSKHSSREKLDVLEKTLAEKISQLSEIFVGRKVELYITAFDQNYEDIFNILACQKVGIKTKCIAHALLGGDIKVEPKTNCLPVLADELYVWCQEDYDFLKGFEEIEKVKVGGYPKFTREYLEEKRKEFSRQRIITFFSGYTLDKKWIQEDALLRERLFRKLKEVGEKYGYRVYIRYHPTWEKNVRKNEKRSVLKKYNISVSKNPLIKDLLQTEVALSPFGASCSYEAKLCGGKSYVLHSCYDELFRAGGIEYIDIDDIDRKIEEKFNDKLRCDLLMDPVFLLTIEQVESKRYVAVKE